MTGDSSAAPADLSGERLAEIFDAPAPGTVGLEEEVMLLDPESFDLDACAPEVLDRLDGDPRFKPELPASQVEIITEPVAAPGDAISAIAAGRRDLAAAARGLARPAVAGVHPFAAPEGELTSTERYERTASEYGQVARRQLVTSLQVQVAVGGAERSLAVYNALRGYLPEIAALAANAPYHAGVDTGFASVRPKIAEALPRQGVPPSIESWEDFAGALRWGSAAGRLPEPGLWWWELRPHPAFGTLEVRVPDAQTTLGEAAGVVAFVHALVVWLAERHEDGERLGAPPTWRIEENRWSAARDGLDGWMADLVTGELVSKRERLRTLLASIEPTARRLGSDSLLGHAAALIEVNGAIRQREVAADAGVPALGPWLASRFLSEDP